MTDRELAACPFCGGDARVVCDEGSGEKWDGPSFIVRCPSIVGEVVSGCLGNFTNLWDMTPEDAAKRWNRRTPAVATSGELAEVLALLEKATPGEWSSYRKVGEFGADYVVTSDSADRKIATVHHYGNPEPSEANTRIIAAAVNFLRKYGPALLSRAPGREDARDAADAQAWRQWCEAVGAEQVVALSEKFGDALGLVKDAARYRWLREGGEDPFVCGVHGDPFGGDGWLTGDLLDSAVDAAMEKERP